MFKARAFHRELGRLEDNNLQSLLSGEALTYPDFAGRWGCECRKVNGEDDGTRTRGLCRHSERFARN